MSSEAQARVEALRAQIAARKKSPVVATPTAAPTSPPNFGGASAAVAAAVGGHAPSAWNHWGPSASPPGAAVGGAPPAHLAPVSPPHMVCFLCVYAINLELLLTSSHICLKFGPQNMGTNMPAYAMGYAGGVATPVAPAPAGGSAPNASQFLAELLRQQQDYIAQVAAVRSEISKINIERERMRSQPPPMHMYYGAPQVTFRCIRSPSLYHI
jgi:hypothetical protein